MVWSISKLMELRVRYPLRMQIRNAQIHEAHQTGWHGLMQTLICTEVSKSKKIQSLKVAILQYETVLTFYSC